MSKPEYMAMPWYALLRDRCSASNQTKVSEQLGVSRAAVCCVVNGIGPYGDGSASTARIADRVLHTFGRYECPHLTEQAEPGERVVVTADQCRAFAHRVVPVGSPRELQHRQASRRGPHTAASAPPVERPAKPRRMGGYQDGAPL